jgi:hypothetical protein
MLKSFLSAALALSLISGSAAFAEPPGGHRDRGNWSERHHGERYHGRHHRGGDDAGAAVAVGLGLFALVAIMAAQDRERERDAQYQGDYRGEDRDGPPPSYDERDYPPEDR